MVRRNSIVRLESTRTDVLIQFTRSHQKPYRRRHRRHLPMTRPKQVRVRSRSEKIHKVHVDAEPSHEYPQNTDTKTLSFIMSEAVHTKDGHSTRETTPPVSVKRSISWASDVKPPREGGMRMGAKWVRQKKKESTQDDSSEEEGQDNETEGGQHGNESEEEEVDDEADREGEQLKNPHSQGPGCSNNGTNTTITQRSQLPSAATASKIAVSRLPNEPDFDASQWANKS
jgi:hypothetical protein